MTPRPGRGRGRALDRRRERARRAPVELGWRGATITFAVVAAQRA